MGISTLLIILLCYILASWRKRRSRRAMDGSVHLFVNKKIEYRKVTGIQSFRGGGPMLRMQPDNGDHDMTERLQHRKVLTQSRKLWYRFLEAERIVPVQKFRGTGEEGTFLRIRKTLRQSKLAKGGLDSIDITGLLKRNTFSGPLWVFVQHFSLHATPRLLPPISKEKANKNSFGQLFVLGGGRTVLLGIPGFPDATIEDILKALISRRIISEKQLSMVKVGYGGWGVLCPLSTLSPLPTRAKLSEMGITHGSSLILSWRVRGGQSDAADTPTSPINQPEGSSACLPSTPDDAAANSTTIGRTRKVNLAHVEIPYGKGSGARVFKGSVTNGHNRNLQDTLTFPQDSVDLHNELEPNVNQSKKRKRVSLRDTDHNFSPSSSEPESEEQDDDEDFEDSSSRNRKKLKLSDGHRIRHRKSRRSTGPPLGSRKATSRSAPFAKDKENINPTTSIKSSTSFGVGIQSNDISTFRGLSKRDKFDGVGVIKQTDGSITYEFDGFRCHHSERALPLTPSSAGIMLAVGDLDGSCAGLRAHSMYLCQPVQAIYCQTHMALIPYPFIGRHILTRHRHTFQLQSSGSPFLDFMRHLLHSFGVLSSQAHSSTVKEDDGWEPLLISQPLPFLRSPGYYVLSPSTSCRHAFETQPGSDARKCVQWRKHIRQHPSCQLALGYDPSDATPNVAWNKLPLPQVRYGQIACTMTTGQRWFLFLPEEWQPSAPLVVSPSNALADLLALPKPDKLPPSRFPINQIYVSQLGWDTALPHDVIDAYAALLYMAPQQSTKEEMALDRGLSEINAFLCRYLQTANTFLGEACIRVRQIVTAGTKSKYRDLSPQTLLHYRDPLFLTISLLLWYNFQCEMRRPLVNRVNLGLTNDIKQAVKKLYTWLQSVGEEEDICQEELAKHVHRLLTALLISQRPVTEKVGGPLEYTFILAMYLGQGKFRQAPQLSKFCAMLQYCLRTIVVHVVRLGSLNVDYSSIAQKERVNDSSEPESEGEEIDNPLLPPEEFQGPSPEDSQSDETKISKVRMSDLMDDEEESEDVDASGLWDTVPAESFINPMDIDGSEAASLTEENPFKDMKSDGLLQVFESHRRWLQNTFEVEDCNQPTAFQRMKHIWLVIWPYAIRAVGTVQITWDIVGHTLTYKDSRCAGHAIPVSKFRHLAQKLNSEVKCNTLELLPSRVNVDNIFESIQITAIVDNPTIDSSIFEQNEHIFAPYVDEISNLLLSDGDSHGLKDREGVELERCQAWLTKEQTLARHILGAYYFSTGICPRAFQAADLRHKSSSSGGRNVFAFKDRAVIGWPKSKAFNRSVQAALWALPLELGKFFLLYYGVLRPVAIRIAEAANIPVNPEAKMMLFVKTIQARPNSKTNRCQTYINATLKSLTNTELGLGMGAARLRQVITAIYRKHLTHLIDPVPISSEGSTVELGAFRTLHLTDQQIDLFFHVARGWQELFGLEKGQLNLCGLEGTTPALQDESRCLTMERLRVLLARSWQYLPKRSDLCLTTKPYPELWKAVASILIESDMDECLGHEALLQVAAGLLFGPGKPGVSDAAPLNGYPESIIAESLALILLGQKEHRDSIPRSLNDSAVIAFMDQAIVFFNRWMTNLREENADEWVALGAAVFLRATNPPVTNAQSADFKSLLKSIELGTKP